MSAAKRVPESPLLEGFRSLPPIKNISKYLWYRLLPTELAERVRSLPINEWGHGVDPFGLSKDGVARYLAVTRWLYEHYFRVISHNIKYIPERGRAILACNHSGQIPLDAMMIAHDVVRRSRGLRVARPALDYFVPGLPWINLLYTGVGAVGGSRGNFHHLLENEELLLVFPEGVRGVGKAFSQRYKLQNFSEGHAELAIRHGAPVVPMCVIGAEEQWPQITRIEGVRKLGIPYLPVPATPFPLPVRYHIRYGPPIPVSQRYDPKQAMDSAAISELALEVKNAVAALIEQGLAQRKGIFR